MMITAPSTWHRTSSSQRIFFHLQHPEELTEFSNWIFLTPTCLAARQRPRQRSSVKPQSHPIRKMINPNKLPCSMKHLPEQILSSNLCKGQSHCSVTRSTVRHASPRCTIPRGRTSAPPTPSSLAQPTDGNRGTDGVQGTESLCSDTVHSPSCLSKVNDTEGQDIQQGAGRAPGMENTTPEVCSITTYNLSRLFCEDTEEHMAQRGATE